MGICSIQPGPKGAWHGRVRVHLLVQTVLNIHYTCLRHVCTADWTDMFVCVWVSFSTVCGRMGWMLYWGRRWRVNSPALTWTLFWTWRWSSASWTWRTSKSLRLRPLSPKNPVIMTLSMTATNPSTGPSDFVFFINAKLEEKKNF